MVSRGYWRILGLAIVQFSKAFQRCHDETTGVKHMLGCSTHHQAEQSIHEDIFELVKSSQNLVRPSRNEVFHDDCSASETHHSSATSARKKLKTTDEKSAGEHKLKENPEENSRPLTEERKAEISANLALYQKSLDDMKVEGQLMKHWLDVLMDNEKLLEEYSKVTEQDINNSSILKILYIFQRDMRKVVRTRFRTWGSVGGYIFEPAAGTKTEKPGQGRPAEVQKMTEKETTKNLPDSEGNAVQGQHEAQPKLSYDALGVVHNQLMKKWLEDLGKIFHSVSFPSHDEHSNTAWEELRVIKVAFEKTMFQAIEFLRKFDLIEKKQFDELFSNTYMLDCIAIHLVDLLQVVKYRTYNPLAFLPDMDFLEENWKTVHLQGILKNLDRSQIAHIIGTALASTVQLHKLSVHAGRKTEWSETIYKLILEEQIIQKLNKRASGKLVSLDMKPNSEDTHLDDSVKQLVNMLQEPDLNPGWQITIDDIPRKQLSRLQTEYFLIYHVLNFIHTYHSNYLRSLFGEYQEIEYKIFMKQLEILKQGLKLNQTLQQGQTYTEIIESEYTALYTFSKDYARIQLKEMKDQYKTISKGYKNINNDFDVFVKNDPKAKFWFQGNGFSSKFLNSFRIRAESWEDGIKIEKARRYNLVLGHYSWRGRQAYKFIQVPLQYFFSWEKNSKYFNKDLLNILDPKCFYL